MIWLVVAVYVLAGCGFGGAVWDQCCSEDEPGFRLVATLAWGIAWAPLLFIGAGMALWDVWKSRKHVL